MIKQKVDMGIVNEVIDAARENGLPTYKICGVLNDEWLIIDNDHSIEIDSHSSEFILLTYEYKNNSSNNLFLIQTDDGNIADDFLERYISSL